MDTLLKWSFALLTVTIAWQLKLPKYLNRLADRIGATQRGFLRRLIVDGGVPAILVVVAGGALSFYHLVLWPIIPNSNCQRGWWAYALVAEGGQETAKVVGRFKLEHTSLTARARDGRAFYFSRDTLSYRGDWEAENVWVRDDNIRFLFSMHAVNPAPRAMPSRYDGFVEIRRRTDSPVMGISTWSGYFQDLGDRRHVSGPVYAEKLDVRMSSPATKIEDLLNDRAAKLLEKAEAMRFNAPVGQHELKSPEPDSVRSDEISEERDPARP